MRLLFLTLVLLASGCDRNGGAPEAPVLAWSHADVAGATARPHADAELAVFTTLFDTRVVALDVHTGAPRWTRSLPRLIPHLHLPVGGNLLAHEDLLLVPGWDLFALDRATGAVRWRFAPPEEFPATTAIALRQGTVYSPGAQRLYAVRAADGHQLWSVDLGERPFAPVVADGVVYLGTREVIPGTDALGAGHAVAVADGQILWRTPIPGHPEHPREGGVVRAGALSEDLFIVGSRNGRVYGLDRGSGDIRWEYDGGSPYDAGVAVLGDVAVVANLRGDIEGLDVATGNRRWRVDIGGSSIVTPIVVEGECALVTVGAVLCVDASGSVRWEHGGASRGGPGYSTSGRAVARRLFIGSTEGFHSLVMP